MTIWQWPHAAVPQMRGFRLRPFNINAIASQTQELIPGGLMVQRFQAKITMPEMDEDRWRELDGLLAELAGTGGQVRFWDPARPEPYYNKTVSETQASWDGGALWSGDAYWSSGRLPPYVIVAETARRGATNILLSGLPASLSGVLRRGDLFEAQPNGTPADHGHLYDVTRFANSDADGLSRVYFKPGLRKGLRVGDKIVLGGAGVYPSSVFRLASDDEGDIEAQPGRGGPVGALGLTLIEILPHA